MSLSAIFVNGELMEHQSTARLIKWDITKFSLGGNLRYVQIRDFRIWNTSRTSSQIRDNMYNVQFQERQSSPLLAPCNILHIADTLITMWETFSGNGSMLLWLRVVTRNSWAYTLTLMSASWVSWRWRWTNARSIYKILCAWRRFPWVSQTLQRTFVPRSGWTRGYASQAWLHVPLSRVRLGHCFIDSYF